MVSKITTNRAKIDLSLSEMQSGKHYMTRKINGADLSEGGRISLPELAEATGLGTSLLGKLFKYAANIEFSGDSEGVGSVDLKIMKKALGNIASTSSKVAKGKGDKNRRLDGTEMKKFLIRYEDGSKVPNESAQAFVRLVHNLKGAGEI